MLVWERRCGRTPVPKNTPPKTDPSTNNKNRPAKLASKTVPTKPTKSTRGPCVLGWERRCRRAPFLGNTPPKQPKHQTSKTGIQKGLPKQPQTTNIQKHQRTLHVCLGTPRRARTIPQKHASQTAQTTNIQKRLGTLNVRLGTPLRARTNPPKNSTCSSGNATIGAQQSSETRLPNNPKQQTSKSA